MFTFLSVPLLRLLQEIVIPAWVIGLVPVLVMVITYVLAKVPALAAFGKRNIVYVVAAVLGLPVTLAALPAAPGFPPFGGDLQTFVAALVAWGGWWWAAWLLYTKAAQAVYDLINGQLTTPEGAAV